MIVFGLLFTTHGPQKIQVRSQPSFWTSFWAFLEDQKAARLTEASEN